ncbi:MAG: glycosyltransferase family 4 protein [Patescibacteria group bacterium]|nr:glycosyltransferase family 4 protein [Patescibacteria group bacterium]
MIRKKLRIAIITCFDRPLNSEAHGYYYRLYHLVNGLTERGHHVTVLAHPDSKIKGHLIKADAKKINWETQLARYTEFLKNYGDKFDIINAQTDHMCCYLTPLIKTPMVHTVIYGGFNDVPAAQEALVIFKKQNFITLSNSLKKVYPYLNWQGVVYNGLDIKAFKFQPKPKNYLLFLARVHHNKGIMEAIQAAHESGEKLIIAGMADEHYFNKYIKPKLNQNISYFGHANFKQKVELLRNAKALLHPHLLPEGFGNSMIEAQACGTPVIAYPYGSTSEVVQHGKTGFIVKNVRQMKAAIKRINKIDRTDCRDFVAQKFNLEQMIQGYENVYYKIINKSGSL